MDDIDTAELLTRMDERHRCAAYLRVYAIDMFGIAERTGDPEYANGANYLKSAAELLEDWTSNEIPRPIADTPRVLDAVVRVLSSGGAATTVKPNVGNGEVN